MKWPDPGEAPARLANRVIESQDWARATLAPLSGRSFSLAVGPLRAAWSVQEGGTLAAATSAATLQLQLTLSPLSVPSFLADPTRWNEFVQEEGDPELGGALKELARTLPWFVEETFAKALGPIVGQRVADAGRKLLAFPEFAAQRVVESAGSYARDEAGLLAHGADARRLREEIDEVAARIDALAQRVEALAPRVRPLR
jgi:ubiquinone biosynthesis protein UbiJ